MKMTVAAPVSFSPNSHRDSSMKLAPTKLATAPTAVASAFICTTCSRGTTRGSEADRPEVTNRLTPLTSRAPARIAQSSALDRQQRPDAGDQHQPRRVGADQNITAVPPVQQRSGERPEQRVRQEQHRERPRRRPTASQPDRD